VAKARCAEIHPPLIGQLKKFPRVAVGRGDAQQVLHQRVAPPRFVVEPAGDVRRLLQKGGVGVSQEARVYWDSRALRAEDGVHHRNVLRGVVL